MGRKHAKPEEIIANLREVDVRLSQGGSTAREAGQKYLDIYPDFESGLHTLNLSSEESRDIIRILDQLVSGETSSALTEKAWRKSGAEIWISKRHIKLYLGMILQHLRECDGGSLGERI